MTERRVDSADWRDGWREGFEAMRRRIVADHMMRGDFEGAQKWLGVPVPEAPSEHPVHEEKL